MYDRLTELLLLEGAGQHRAARQAARRDHDEKKFNAEQGWIRYSSQWSKKGPPAAKLKSYRETYLKERERLRSQPVKGILLPKPKPTLPEPTKPERPPIVVEPIKPSPTPAPVPAPRPTTPDPEEPDIKPDTPGGPDPEPQEKIKKKKNKFKKKQPYSKLVDLVRQAAAVSATKQVY